MRRLIAAAESLAIDYRGISIVSRATGVSRRAIARGIVELGNPPVPSGGAIRKPGGGRKRTAEQDETLVRDLESLIEPLSRGDPESALRWTCKSVRKLAQELGRTIVVIRESCGKSAFSPRPWPLRTTPGLGSSTPTSTPVSTSHRATESRGCSEGELSLSIGKVSQQCSRRGSPGHQTFACAEADIFVHSGELSVRSPAMKRFI
jgi:hypothetical protein